MDRRKFLTALGLTALHPEYVFAQAATKIARMGSPTRAQLDSIRQGDARILDRTGLCRGKESKD
jgi:hypothetical protein